MTGGQDPVSQRRDYGAVGLDVDDLDADPVRQLQAWIEHAGTGDHGVEPSAMVLCTVDHEGRPSSRTVLLRRVRNGRLYFFTSYTSRKARQADLNPHVSLLFRWPDPIRQVEVQGMVARASAEESDEYFASRPRGSQIGAHASPQSAPIADRGILDARVAQVTAAHEGREGPRPPSWGGYVVTPTAFDFWQGRADRLHDRFAYTWSGHAWRISRVAP